MKKLLALALVGAVSLAACGGGSSTIASTVNGHDITVGQVEALLETDGAVVKKEDFAQFLSYSIQWVIVNEAAEADYGVTTSEDEVAAEADRIIADVLPEDQTREEFLAGQGITEEFLSNIARQGLVDVAIREIMLEDTEEPTEEEIDAERESAVSVCASHILVATEDEADDVVTRLDAGEDFAELATELSLDTTSGANGGALGCESPDTYVETFAEATRVATVGEVYEEIVESEYGFHVIMVTDRIVPTDEELVDIIKENAVLTMLEDWFLGAVADADVTVGEEYGTWQPNPPTVVPPSS